MMLNGQTVGGLTVYCVGSFITWYHSAGWHSVSFRTTVDDVKWTDSRRVNCILCGCIQTWYHSAGWHSVSFKTTVDDVKWTDSRRVNCVLCGCIHNMVS